MRTESQGRLERVRRVTAPVWVLLKLHWIALSVVAGVVLLYTLAGFFLVPHLARSYVTRYVTETLHRQVSIGEIRFNPFAFDASVSDVRLQEADGAPLVSLRHLYVDAELASLWQRAVVLKTVRLSAPDVALVVANEGSVNLAKLLPPSQGPEPEEESEPPRVRIGTLAVTEGRIGVVDHTRAQPFTAAVAPIKFTLTDFDTDIGHRNAYDFKGTTLSGERLTWSGGFTVQPLGSAGQFRIDGLKAATLESYLRETLPFKLASGEMDLGGAYRFALDPLAFDVTLPSIAVRNLALAEKNNEGSVPIVVPEADLRDIAFSYANRAINLKLLAIRGARVDVVRESDESLSVMRLFDAGTAVNTEGPSATAAETEQDDFSARVDTVQITDASVSATDRAIAPATTFQLTPINLTVSGWSTDPAARLQIDSQMTINERGKLRVAGDLQLEPLNTQLSVELTDFGLPALQPYVASMTAMTLHSGVLGVKGDVSYAATPASAPPLSFTGAVEVANLRTTDRLVKGDFIKWRKLAITDIDFRQNPDKLSIGRVVAQQPYARVVIAEDASLNVTKVLDSGAAGQERGARARKAGAAKAPADRPLPMRIKSVRILDGSANFADYSIQPSFASGILGLNGDVTGLSSDPASRAKVKLDGKVDKYAPVDITGDVNLLAAAMYTDLAMNFRNMELTLFNPYSGKFAGYNISKGKLSTELRYKVQDRRLDAAHHIVLDNLEFGDKTESKDAAPIPLKLAVALLKDRHGVIDVNLPVTGTLDDPSFRLGPLVWKAVLGLLTKAVTAPFAALGALFGGGDELAYVEFTAGSAALPLAETEKLNRLAKALVERPQLKLNVPLSVATAQDSDAIARAALAAKLPADAADPPDDEAKRERLKLLEDIYEQGTKAAAEYPPETLIEGKPDVAARLRFLESALLERLRPDDAMLTALAQERASTVRDVLLANTELSPERVFITAERVEGKPVSDAVRMELKLE